MVGGPTIDGPIVQRPVVKPRSRVVRGLYFLLGLFFLGLAFLSVLPGIPTADSLILAAFFFARSSDRFHAWLMNHKVFGRIIRGYQAGLPVRAKVVASIGIVASIGLSAVLLIDDQLVRTILGVVGLFALWYVWTRPGPAEVASRSPAGR